MEMQNILTGRMLLFYKSKISKQSAWQKQEQIPEKGTSEEFIRRSGEYMMLVHLSWKGKEEAFL